MVAAVAVVGACTATASADQWTTDSVNPFAGTAHMMGRLTQTITANGAQTSCDITAALDLSNPGTPPVAHGQVTSYVFGAPAGGTCTTTVPGCSVTISAWGLPWTIATSGTSVTVSGTTIAWVYSGATCPLAGVPLSATGTITGSMSGHTVTFANAGPITTTFGPATVSGSMTVRSTTGDPISLF